MMYAAIKEVALTFIRNSVHERELWNEFLPCVSQHYSIYELFSTAIFLPHISLEFSIRRHSMKRSGAENVQCMT